MPIHVKTVNFLAGIIVAGILASPSFAQRSGPSKSDRVTVAEILKHPVDDQDVRLKGHLLRQDTSDRYVFSDGTGQIFAQIETMRFPGLSFDASTDIELTGEVNTRPEQAPEIEDRKSTRLNSSH